MQRHFCPAEQCWLDFEGTCAWCEATEQTYAPSAAAEPKDRNRPVWRGLTEEDLRLQTPTAAVAMRYAEVLLKQRNSAAYRSPKQRRRSSADTCGND